MRGNNFQQLSEVISSFYDAALGHISWEEPLSLAAKAMNANNAVFSVRDPLTRKANFAFGNFGTSEVYVKNFAEKYATLSPFVVAMAICPDGKAINPINLIGREEYENGRFFKEWSAPQNYHDYVGTILLRRPNAIYTLAFGRTKETPLFGDDDLEILDFITPHVVKALTISERLNTFEREKAELLLTFDSLASPLILVDREFKIRQINSAASTLLQKSEGIYQVRDVLHFNDPILQKEFRAAQYLQTGHASTFKSKLANGMQISALAQNIRTGRVNSATRDERILIMFDHAKTRALPSAEIITRKYDLTVAELRVLLRLVDGATIKSAAEDLGLSTSTIKTHIAHLFQKTGTNRQSQLLRVISEEPVKTAPAG
jgi:DNA-binding CsgD family transcriptional regulator/PAS domain-containing protein